MPQAGIQARGGLIAVVKQQAGRRSGIPAGFSAETSGSTKFSEACMEAVVFLYYRGAAVSPLLEAKPDMAVELVGLPKRGWKGSFFR
jgi:hypothetical protein